MMRRVRPSFPPTWASYGLSSTHPDPEPTTAKVIETRPAITKRPDHALQIVCIQHLLAPFAALLRAKQALLIRVVGARAADTPVIGSWDSQDSTSFLRSKGLDRSFSMVSFSSSKTSLTSGDTEPERVCSSDSWMSSEEDATKHMNADARSWDSSAGSRHNTVGCLSILDRAEPSEGQERGELLSQEDTCDGFALAQAPCSGQARLPRSASLFNAAQAPTRPFLRILSRSNSGPNATDASAGRPAAASPERKRSCIRGPPLPPHASPELLTSASSAGMLEPASRPRFLVPAPAPAGAACVVPCSILRDVCDDEAQAIVYCEHSVAGPLGRRPPTAPPPALKDRSMSLPGGALAGTAPAAATGAPAMRRCISQVAPTGYDEHETAKKLVNFKDPESLMECIAIETAGQLLSGAPEMRALYDRVVVIDCRFPYEYEGGHIRVPPHLADWLEVIHIPPHESKTAIDLFFGGGGARPLCATLSQDRVCAVFHCEFSQRRGPEMLKEVRRQDRLRVPFELFPQLHYPECYVLHKGYKRFFETFPDMCEPRAYVPEQDPRFAEQCVHFNKERKLAKQSSLSSKRSKAQSRRPLGGGDSWQEPGPPPPMGNV